MNILNFVSMITIPLIATPMVYLSGRLGTRETVLHSRSYLVRGLALLAGWDGQLAAFAAVLRLGIVEGEDQGAEGGLVQPAGDRLAQGAGRGSRHRTPAPRPDRWRE